MRIFNPPVNIFEIVIRNNLYYGHTLPQQNGQSINAFTNRGNTRYENILNFSTITEYVKHHHVLDCSTFSGRTSNVKYIKPNLSTASNSYILSSIIRDITTP